MSGETFASRLNSPPASRQSWPCLSWVLPEGTVDATIRQYDIQPPFHISRFGECFPRGREQESDNTAILSDSWNTDSTPRHHLRSHSSPKMKYAGFLPLSPARVIVLCFSSPTIYHRHPGCPDAAAVCESSRRLKARTPPEFNAPPIGVPDNHIPCSGHA